VQVELPPGNGKKKVMARIFATVPPSLPHQSLWRGGKEKRKREGKESTHDESTSRFLKKRPENAGRKNTGEEKEKKRGAPRHGVLRTFTTAQRGGEKEKGALRHQKNSNDRRRGGEAHRKKRIRARIGDDHARGGGKKENSRDGPYKEEKGGWDSSLQRGGRGEKGVDIKNSREP